LNGLLLSEQNLLGDKELEVLMLDGYVSLSSGGSASVQSLIITLHLPLFSEVGSRGELRGHLERCSFAMLGRIP
jgi:hypothetical protein